MTGTGFMKWNPMNRSGRSVRLARRVMEIDEVLEVRIVSGFRCGSRSSKIAVLPFPVPSRPRSRGRSVPHRSASVWCDAAHRLGFRILGDLAAPDLPAEVLRSISVIALSSASWLMSVMMTS
jgi:hypothetical protein